MNPVQVKIEHSLKFGNSKLLYGNIQLNCYYFMETYNWLWFVILSNFLFLFSSELPVILYAIYTLCDYLQPNAFMQVEALAVKLTQKEGELIQEKFEVKKLANFLKQVIDYLVNLHIKFFFWVLFYFILSYGQIIWELWSCIILKK